MTRSGRRTADSRGMTLVELVVAMAILTTVVLAGMSSFTFITKSIHRSRTRTIANNLVQEKMEVLKNYSYYSLLVTTDAYTDPNYGGTVVYDRSRYTAEQITLWGYPTFTRAVHVAYAETTGTSISTVSYASVDTGLKQIISYLLWKDGDDYKKIVIKNLLANPSVAGMDSAIAGSVAIAGGGGALAGAKVSVVGFPNWTGESNAAGAYSFTVAKGTYSVLCSSAGFFDQVKNSISAPRGGSGSASFNMVKIGTGAIAGNVWVSTNILISQVVAGTGTYDGGTKEKEYVELYNPTTFTWTIDGAVELVYRQKDGGPAAETIALTYNTATLPSYRYYLIASTGVIVMNGVARTADAVYQSVGSDIIKEGSSGGVGIRIASNGRWLDRFAWTLTNGGVPVAGQTPDPTFIEHNAPEIEGGLIDGGQFVRYTDPSCSVVGAAPAMTYGNAYDTDRNYVNFYNYGGDYNVHSSADSLTPVSGKPAHGAFALASDGHSTGAQASPVSYDTCNETARFFFADAATGTWTVTIASGSYKLEVSNVVVTQNSTNTIPNAATSPAWPAAGYNSDILVSTASGGFLQGYVYGDGTQFNTPLNNILCEAGGVQVRTTVTGYLVANVPAGTVIGHINYNSDNTGYATASANFTITEGGVVNFGTVHLAQSGVVTGYVTSGTGALPNIVVKAVRNVTYVYEGYSDQTGYFYIYVPSDSAAYTVTPVLAQGQAYTSSPATLSATISSMGQWVHVGTITVSGGLGTISGIIKDDSGNPVTTGVLVLASAGTINDPPDTIYGSNSPGLANPVYSVSSQADGTYSLEVTAGSYNMAAYYPVVNTATQSVTYKRKSKSNVNVTAGGSTPNTNFTAPPNW